MVTLCREAEESRKDFDNVVRNWKHFLYNSNRLGDNAMWGKQEDKNRDLIVNILKTKMELNFNIKNKRKVACVSCKV